MSQCSKCRVELNAENWLSSRRRRNQSICQQCVRQDNNVRYRLRKVDYLAQNSRKRQQIKLQVQELYGGHCQLCGQNDPTKLSLDHMDGHGRQDREKLLGTDSGTRFYHWVLNHQPTNLRLLCFNCNCRIDMTPKLLVKSHPIGCQYCGNLSAFGKRPSCRQCRQIIRRNRYIALKLEVFTHYGARCANCHESHKEFLTIDHINNDGARHRQQIGTQIFPWLKRNSYPTNFQVLCFNCNYLKHFVINTSYSSIP